MKKPKNNLVHVIIDTWLEKGGDAEGFKCAYSYMLSIIRINEKLTHRKITKQEG